MTGGLGCLWASRFFGLTPEYKASLHKEIFSLGYNSEGFLNQEIIYRLPIHLRRFYLNELNIVKKKENDANNAANQPPPETNGVYGPGGVRK